MNQTSKEENKTIVIEGEKHENFKRLDSKGKLFGSQNGQFIIKQDKKYTKDEIEVLKQIRIKQNEVKPKCQHIIKILGIEEKEDVCVYMEKGKDNILNLINSNKSLSQVQKIQIFEQMVKGVIELHGLGYFHRDLKPENFVYFENQNKDYKVKLIDFGIVKENSTTLKTQQVGTWNYMAPEVIVAEGIYDKTADIWSLGIILYEILTSQNFLQATNQKKIIQEVKNLNQEQINNRINQVYKKGQLENDLIISMLQKESKNRIDLETLLQKIEKCIMENILKEQNLLEQKVKDKEISDQQLKEHEQKLKKEKEEYQSLLAIIKTIQEQINFYQRIKLQIQGEERNLNVQKQHQTKTQDILMFEQAEIIIQKFNSLEKEITSYQQCNSKLKELQQSQNKLKILIEEANKFIQQIDRQYLDKHQQQIDDLNDTLNDLLDKFQYQSNTSQINAYKIKCIINNMEKDFSQLNSLKELIYKRNLEAYQQFNSNYNNIKQSIKDYCKLYNQQHQQIYNVIRTNNERIKKYQNAETQLNLFQEKMNQLKEQINNLINNQYCNNEQKDNLNNQRQNIDQNIQEYLNEFKSFNQTQQLNSCESINCQIKQLEEFQTKLQKVEINEKRQVDENQQRIYKYKSEQEKEILNSNNQLQNMYKQFSKALQSIKLQFESIELYRKINENKDKLHEQLKQEIKTLEEYQQIQHLNTQLFNQELKKIQTKKGNQKQQIEDFLKKQQFEDFLKKQQQINKQKGGRLENVINKVYQKQSELNFTLTDDNLIKNYEQLKMQEKQFQIELNKIDDKISNQQLNPQQLNELKEYILKIYYDINESKMKIPQDNEVQEFNKAYQQNLESYQKLCALVNYIKQYHLTRYYERIKENANNQKKKEQNKNESDDQKLFQSKLISVQDEDTKKEKEAQDILQRYEYALNENQNKMAIEIMEKDQDEIDKQIQKQENILKYKYLVKLRANLKDQSMIKEIVNQKQYYKICEFAQMLIFNIINKENKQMIKQ